MTDAAPPLLEVRSLTKTFGDLQANQNIDLAIYGGEVHAILGENGAGKSTLMKCLYGFYQPTSGEILLEGKPVRIATPLAGRRLRIGMVFQNFTLIPAMTVAENVALFLPELGIVLQPKAIRARIAAVAARYGLEIDPGAHVADLAMGERQKVEILKILLAGARVLIFDEPTSVLAPHEVDGLFAIFEKLREDGYAVLFITHKLPEVMASAQRITVLRRGRVAGQMLHAEATPQAIVRLMLGAEPPPPVHREGLADEEGTPQFELRSVDLIDEHTGVGLKGVSLQLFAGEIVGVAGVSGNGQSELADVALGLRRLDGGAVLLEGQDTAHWSTAEILDHGLACIPEDPLRMGAIPGMTVLENMILGEQAHYARRGGLTMQWPQARSAAEQHLNTTFVTTAPRLDLAGGEPFGRQPAARGDRPRAEPQPQGAAGLLPGTRAGRLQCRGHAQAAARLPQPGHGHPADLRRYGRAVCAERPAGRHVSRPHRRHVPAARDERRRGRSLDDGRRTRTVCGTSRAAGSGGLDEHTGAKQPTGQPL